MAVTKCCCGCTLVEGTTGIGIFSMVEAMLFFVAGALWHSEADSTYRIMATAAFVEGGFIVLESICLFAAVTKKNRCLLLPWLIIEGILLVLCFVSALLLIISGAILMSLIQFGWGSMMLYFYMVVLACYKSDMERNVTANSQVLQAASSGVPCASFPQQQNNQYVVGYVVTNAPPAGYDKANVPPAGYTTTYVLPAGYAVANDLSAGTSVQAHSAMNTSSEPYPTKNASQPSDYPQPYHTTVLPPPYSSQSQQKDDNAIQQC